MRSPIEDYGILLALLPPEALWSGSETSACWKSLATALVWHSLGTTPGGTSGSTGVLALASWRRSARSMPTPRSNMLSLFMLFGLLGAIVSLASMPRRGAKLWDSPEYWPLVVSLASLGCVGTAAFELDGVLGRFPHLV